MLSIVILNYNTRDLTLACIDSIIRNTSSLEYEIIVVDNGSTEKFPEVGGIKILRNKKNLGFAAGNNVAKNVVKGEYVLFLNSDTLVPKDTLKGAVFFIDKNKEFGAIGVKIILPSGGLDRDSRRSFPTPWVALTHFSGLDRVFPKSKMFSKYWYGYKSPDQISEVEVLQGAFFLVRKKIMDEVGWFSEDYFLDGEDIDLSWKIKEAGYKIVYNPNFVITHIKKATKNKVGLKFAGRGVEAMEIFYKKHLWGRYPWALNILVLFGIKVLKVLRRII